MTDKTIKYAVYSYEQEERDGSYKWMTPSGKTVICTEVYIDPEYKSNFTDAIKQGEVSEFIAIVSEGSICRI